MGEYERKKSKRVMHYHTADCSLMMTSSICSPNVRKLISAIAAILHTQVEADRGNSNPHFAIFDEQTYLEGEMPSVHCLRLAFLWRTSPLFCELREGIDRKDQTKEWACPTSTEICDFISALYDAAKYSAECNILALLYINRLIAFSGLKLNERNWRPIFFTALLIAQKVWDDKLLSNASFAFIYPFFTAEEMNKLEAAFLKLLQFEVVVKPSTYAKYYFELQAVQDVSCR